MFYRFLNNNLRFGGIKVDGMGGALQVQGRSVG